MVAIDEEPRSAKELRGKRLVGVDSGEWGRSFARSRIARTVKLSKVLRIATCTS